MTKYQHNVSQSSKKDITIMQVMIEKLSSSAFFEGTVEFLSFLKSLVLLDIDKAYEKIKFYLYSEFVLLNFSDCVGIKRMISYITASSSSCKLWHKLLNQLMAEKDVIYFFSVV